MQFIFICGVSFWMGLKIQIHNDRMKFCEFNFCEINLLYCTIQKKR